MITIASGAVVVPAAVAGRCGPWSRATRLRGRGRLHVYGLLLSLVWVRRLAASTWR